MKRYLLIHPEFGVFLGTLVGLGFWSKLDAFGNTCAVTFPSPEEAHAYASTWSSKDLDVNQLTTLPVMADDGHYASVQACVQAGAPGWICPTSPVVGGIQ